MARTFEELTLRGLLDSPAHAANRKALSAEQESPTASLSDLAVIVIDCQATGAAPGGHLLEIGWARFEQTLGEVRARLIALPDNVRIPPAVTRITGIADSLAQTGVAAPTAWREVAADAARLSRQPAPTIIHFARFERPFLDLLNTTGVHGLPPAVGTGELETCLDVVCTHDIARRLLPNLPRRGLRALAGYFGGAVGQLRRSSDHVRATALVWRELIELLAAEGVTSWSLLLSWLAQPVTRTRPARRIFPMPRDIRLAIPDAPGVYRLLRTTGDVVYVGKAASLNDRVNSYFRQQHGIAERMLEMLSQVRAISFEVTPTALEAALLEPVEIKRHRPPYNIALADDDGRTLWFAARDLSERSARPTVRCCVGPFPSAEVLERFAALARVDRRALAQGRSLPDERVFAEGYARLAVEHRELSLDGLDAPRQLLALGTRLWREGVRDRKPNTDETPAAPSADRWTPELVQRALELIALRAVHARRRATWLTRLVDATVIWREPGGESARLLVVENGEFLASDAGDPLPAVPPGHARTVAARHQRLTIARFDRLRILTTELKRLSTSGADVAVRFGNGPSLAGARLAAALWWL